MCLYAVLVLSAYAVYVGGIGKPITQAVTDNPDSVTELLKVSVIRMRQKKKNQTIGSNIEGNNNDRLFMASSSPIFSPLR